MLQRLRTTRRQVRRAIAASALVHGMVAIPVVRLVCTDRDLRPGPVGLETRIHDATLRLPADHDTPIELPPDTPPPQVPSPPETRPAPLLRSLAAVTPNALPAELLTMVRRSSTAAAPPTDGRVLPAGGPTVPPIHGVLQPGQLIVYILDCSGSMGEFGKFHLARSALLSTLRRQPEGVRFQVIVYSGQAKPLLPGGRLLANAANLADAEEYLARLIPSGPSRHFDALRAAAELRPDLIVILTDATELPANKLKGLLAGIGKPVSVYLATVSPAGIASPQELR